MGLEGASRIVRERPGGAIVQQRWALVATELAHRALAQNSPLRVSEPPLAPGAGMTPTHTDGASSL
jgi:hypothetical protein